MNPIFGSEQIDLTIGVIILIGFLIAIFWNRRNTQEMNVPRDTHPRNGDVIYYEDMTPEQKKEYGFIPTNELPPLWQDFMRKSKNEWDSNLKHREDESKKR